MLSVMSFGYKYGVPSEADLVFDVRFLPNPNFVPRLKPLTGNDRAGGALHAAPARDRGASSSSSRDVPALRAPALRPGRQELPHDRASAAPAAATAR